MDSASRDFHEGTRALLIYYNLCMLEVLVRLRNLFSFLELGQKLLLKDLLRLPFTWKNGHTSAK